MSLRDINTFDHAASRDDRERLVMASLSPTCNSPVIGERAIQAISALRSLRHSQITLCLDVWRSDGLWRREFGADPHIIGKALRVDNDVYHVVGIMPRGFRDQG